MTGGAEKITTEYFAGGLDVLIAPENVVNYYQELGGIKETIPLKGIRSGIWEKIIIFA